MMRMMGWVFVPLLFMLVGGAPALLIYWSNEGPPVESPRRTILTPEVEQGGEFSLLVEADLHKHCAGVVYRSIFDGNQAKTEFKPEARPDAAQYRVRLPIPETAKPGDAIYRARTVWSCNPLQRIYPLVVEQPEMHFIILPKGGKSLGFVPQTLPQATATTFVE